MAQFSWAKGEHARSRFIGIARINGKERICSNSVFRSRFEPLGPLSGEHDSSGFLAQAAFLVAFSVRVSQPLISSGPVRILLPGTYSEREAIADAEAVDPAAVENVAAGLVVDVADELVPRPAGVSQGELDRPVEFQVRAFVLGMAQPVNRINFARIGEADAHEEGGLHPIVPRKIDPAKANTAVVVREWRSVVFIHDREGEVRLELGSQRPFSHRDAKPMRGPAEGERIELAARISLGRVDIAGENLPDVPAGQVGNAKLQAEVAHFLCWTGERRRCFGSAGC